MSQDHSQMRNKNAKKYQQPYTTVHYLSIKKGNSSQCTTIVTRRKTETFNLNRMKLNNFIQFALTILIQLAVMCSSMNNRRTVS